LLKAEATLEDIVRGPYRCYQQLDDFGSLILDDRVLHQPLRGIFGGSTVDNQDCEPSTQTVDLFKQIQAELEARVRAGRRVRWLSLNGKASTGDRIVSARGRSDRTWAGARRCRDDRVGNPPAISRDEPASPALAGMALADKTVRQLGLVRR
jgi:hypothetical protein